MRELLAAAWAVPLLQEGQSCWKAMERGWMQPPAPCAPAHPSTQHLAPAPSTHLHQRLGAAPCLWEAFWGPFSGQGAWQCAPFSFPEGSRNGVLGSWGGAEWDCTGLRHGRGAARCPLRATSARPRVPSSRVSPSPALRGSAAQEARSLPALRGRGRRVWDFPAVPSGVLQGAKSGASQQPRWPRAPCAPRGTAGLGAEPSCAPRPSWALEQHPTPGCVLSGRLLGGN